MPRRGHIDLSTLPRFCRYGHDTWAAEKKGGKPARGRMTNGACGECVRQRNRARRDAQTGREVGQGLLAAVAGDVCQAGHAVAVTGRAPRGVCRLCLREYHRRRRRAAGARAYGDRLRSKVRGEFCPRGHDVREVGLSTTGACRACSAVAQRANLQRWRRRRAQGADRCGAGHLMPQAGRCLRCLAPFLCPGGHDKRLVGTVGRGACAECWRLNAYRQNHRRRARLLAVPHEEFDRVALRRAATHCAICLDQLTRADRVELDHLIPLCRGGADVASNLAASHRRCNARKHGKLLRHERDGAGRWLAVLYDESGETIWDGRRILARRPLSAPVSWPQLRKEAA